MLITFGQTEILIPKFIEIVYSYIIWHIIKIQNELVVLCWSDGLFLSKLAVLGQNKPSCEPGVMQLVEGLTMRYTVFDAL